MSKEKLASTAQKLGFMKTQEAHYLEFEQTSEGASSTWDSVPSGFLLAMLFAGVPIEHLEDDIKQTLECEGQSYCDLIDLEDCARMFNMATISGKTAKLVAKDVDTDG